MKANEARREWFEARGFTVSPSGRAYCEQCQALSINGVPCHETGCSNAMHECRGCNAIIPASVKYCQDCQ